MMEISGNVVFIEQREIFFSTIQIENSRIQSIRKSGPPRPGEPYILPGFIDAHVHIESSMLVPTEFARLAVVHGTVASISDPHEIANVLGIEGVQYMLENSKKTPFNIFFGAPSCVPATAFETAGATIDAEGVRQLLERSDIWYLSEMMNYPGVLFGEDEVLKKIKTAKNLGKPVDGHAPGLRGADAAKYIAAGITTDHECYTYEEGKEKLELGMKVIIREGSAAKNFDALINLLPQYPDRIMFCSDDKHPDDLIAGHINQLVARSVGLGMNVFDVLKAACINPVIHYNLPVGRLREGDSADFIMTEDLREFKVKATYIAGELVAENGNSKLSHIESPSINQFDCKKKEPEEFLIPAAGRNIRIIRALNGEIVTRAEEAETTIEKGNAGSKIEDDILKITVVNRYKNAPPAVAFIRGFQIREGAIASSVAHDSHNIVAVGTDDSLIARAVNIIIENQGGIAAVGGSEEHVIPLPIAGIMTDQDGYEVARQYSEIDRFVKQTLGSHLSAPFMTLSFMALLVIPELKLSDKGLFDVGKFGFTEVFI